MNEEDLVSHLGTIARSGTKNFLAQLSGDAKKDSNLIGQFGVGFYSVFMVADKVEVISRKAGEEQSLEWTSDGKTGFDIEAGRARGRRNHRPHPLQRRRRAVRQQLASAGDRQEVLQPHRLSHLSYLRQERVERTGEEIDPSRRTTEQVNAASAMWRRPKVRTQGRGLQGVLQSPSPATGKTRSSGSTPTPKARWSTRLSSTSRPRPRSISTRPTTRAASSSTSSASSSWTTQRSFCPQYLRFVRGIID